MLSAYPVSVPGMEWGLALGESWTTDGKPVPACVRDTLDVMFRQRILLQQSALLRASWVTPDGMHLASSGYPDTGNVCEPDVILAPYERSVATDHRHFFDGYAPVSPKRLVKTPQAGFPRLRLAGIYSPPSRPLSDEDTARTIGNIFESEATTTRIKILHPTQERWIMEYIRHVGMPLFWGFGAVFDVRAVMERRPPCRTQRNGVDRLFRLLNSPNRHWRRHLVLALEFLIPVLMQKLGLEQYPE